MRLKQVVRRASDGQIGHIDDILDHVFLFWPWDGSGHQLHTERTLIVDKKLDEKYVYFDYWGHVEVGTEHYNWIMKHRPKK